MRHLSALPFEFCTPSARAQSVAVAAVAESAAACAAMDADWWWPNNAEADDVDARGGGDGGGGTRGEHDDCVVWVSDYPRVWCFGRWWWWQYSQWGPYFLHARRNSGLVRRTVVSKGGLDRHD